MKICIISDLHCKYQQDSKSYSDTFLISNKPRVPATQHPVAAFLHTANKSSKINSEILLSPGDLGDKADEQGITSSWAFLEEIRIKIGAKLLIGIPGNHDVKSRSTNNDAFNFIKNFNENFPTNVEDLNNKYWESGYCIVIYDRTLILLINTVHDHLDEKSAAQSSISKIALEKIKLDLDQIKSDDFDFKICMLHHHPIKHSNINNYKDSDSLENGDDLINELSKHQFNIVIHGHKHQPRIVEYNGITILACGSFSSFANLQGTGIELMFHVLELNKNSRLGSIESWEFDIKNGWAQNLNKKFPPRIGFGSNIETDDVAKQINDLFIKGGGVPIFYSNVVSEINQLEYLTPEKLIALGRVLRTKYNIETLPEYPLQPNMITGIINN